MDHLLSFDLWMVRFVVDQCVLFELFVSFRVQGAVAFSFEQLRLPSVVVLVDVVEIFALDVVESDVCNRVERKVPIGVV